MPKKRRLSVMDQLAILYAALVLECDDKKSGLVRRIMERLEREQGLKSPINLSKRRRKR